MHYVHERMELNFNKKLLFIILLFEMEASVYFSIKIFSNYRDVEKESRKKMKKNCQKGLKVKERGWTRLERLLLWRVEREGHGEEKNEIAINFLFLNFI